ncbi:MAG: DUF1844 domain-containing protein [Planctomycetota bacterium]|jgi:hypothetical protein|nr:DUF1844 domain-containing protein [Planctomycetota bacterium]
MTENRKPVEASFLQLLGGMAVQTLVHLGQMTNPMTKDMGVDLPNAKYSIDILAILQEKTKGNLTPGETEYLQNILRDLRLQYVSIAGKNENGELSGSAESGRTDEPEEGSKDGQSEN